MSATGKCAAVAAVVAGCLPVVGNGRADNVAVCVQPPVARADGTTGVYVEITTEQWKNEARFKGAPAAYYDEGKGLNCDGQEGYVFTGHTVGSDGKVTGGAGDVYPYFVRVVRG